MRIRGWRRERTSPSLKEVYLNIPVLILRRVVPSLPVSFAVIPLVRFTSDRFKMGEFVNPWWLAALAWVVAVIIAPSTRGS